MKKGLCIYEPKGRAGEYAPLALNLYKGCGHGCVYCYAPESTFTDPQDFKQAEPRPGIINKLRKDAPIARATIDNLEPTVLLSFTSDPYQPINRIHGLTRLAIQILHDNDFRVNILTKGGLDAKADFDLYQDGDQFAVSLTLFDLWESEQWEPKAASPADRVASLRIAHAMGIYTWVSLEPVISPAMTLAIIRQTHEFVDFYKVGKMNHHASERSINWREFLAVVKAELEHHNCKYYIKKDLAAYER